MTIDTLWYTRCPLPTAFVDHGALNGARSLLERKPVLAD